MEHFGDPRLRLVTVTQAARETGKSVRWIRTLCVQNRVVGARKIGRAWIIPSPVRLLPHQDPSGEE